MGKFARCLIAILGICAFSVTLPAQDTSQGSAQKYVTMLEQYNQGKRDPSFVQSFIQVSRALDHARKATEQRAAEEYLQSFPGDTLYTKVNLQFLDTVTDNTSDPGFDIFYRNSIKVDAVLGAGAAERTVDRLIAKTEIDPVTSHELQPDWDAIQTNVAHKYDPVVSDRAVLEGKAIWFAEKKIWSRFTVAALEFVQKYGASNSRMDVNVACWKILLTSSDKQQLTAAAVWIRNAIDAQPDNDILMDTYANLLYKAGKTSEAIQWEDSAIKVDKTMIAKYGSKDFFLSLPKHTYPAELSYHQEMLAKMKDGSWNSPTE